ncbi:MAG: hypothetical protein JXP34_27280 [Planctomycetes bacterium]|nr:hypothetical protein [Planctomycetota bacterium]
MTSRTRMIARFLTIALGACMAAGGCKGSGGGGETPGAQPAALGPASKFTTSLRGPDLMGQLALYYTQFGLLLSAGEVPLVAGEGKRIPLVPSLGRRLLSFTLPETSGFSRVPRKTTLLGLQLTNCRQGSSNTETFAVASNAIQSWTQYAACRGVLSTGEEVLLDGRVTATAEDPDYTGTNPLADVGTGAFVPTIFDIVYDMFLLEIRDPGDASYLEVLEANGSIHALEETDDNELGRIDEIVNGEFATLARDSTFEENAAFTAQDLSIIYDIREFGVDDLITDWSFMLTGALLYEDRTQPGRGIDATFDGFLLDWLTTDTADVLEFNGGFHSDCLGGANEVQTLEALVIPFDEECPISGRMAILGDVGTYELEATAAGGVAIDIDADGTVEETLSSCQDSTLCPI